VIHRGDSRQKQGTASAIPCRPCLYPSGKENNSCRSNRQEISQTPWREKNPSNLVEDARSIQFDICRLLLLRRELTRARTKSMPRVNPHLSHEQPTYHAPKIISNPVVPACAPPYAQDHVYTHNIYNHIYCR
jgi:hypothetical protein